MIWLQWLPFFASLALQIFVIASLRRGGYKDYPFVFVYSLVLIMTTVADGAGHAHIRDWASGFYRNEALRQLLLFTVVMSLMDRAMRGRLYRGSVRIFLTLSAFVVVLISAYVHRGAHVVQFGLWRSQVSRDLSFGSVILTLLLWVTLISSRRKDTQLLMITGGLGLQFTGEAIGQSIRQLSNHHHTLLAAGNGLMIASHLIRLYVWYNAFRRTEMPQEMKEPDGNINDFPRQAQQTLTEAIV